jgi:hypothetical protein
VALTSDRLLRSNEGKYLSGSRPEEKTMKFGLRTLVLFAVILSACAAFSAEGGRMKSVKKEKTKSSLTLSAALPEKCIAGERIEITASLTNQRKTDVVYYGSGPIARDFHVTINDTRGKEIPLTEFGKSVFPKSRPPRISLMEKVLSPGKTDCFTFNLSRLFDLTKAGDYSLHLERDIILDEKDNKGKFIRVNLKLDVPFKISEPSK